MAVIGIFGSGKVLADSRIYKEAESLGKLLAEKNFDLVTGAYYGVMEAALKGASGSEVLRIGVATNYFSDKKPNKYINSLIITGTYDERLRKLIEISDAYIIFQGGTGTLLEFSYILAMKERNIIKNKLLICFGDVWKSIAELMGYEIENGTIKSLQVEFVDSAEDVMRLIDKYF